MTLNCHKSHKLTRGNPPELSNSEGFVRPSFNSGVDVVFLAIRKQTLLARKRLIQQRLGISEITLRDIVISARDKRDLKEISKKTGLVLFYPNTKKPKKIVFKNESKWLKEFLKDISPLKNNLSITQKAFIYSSAVDFKIATNLNLSKFKSLSWTILALVSLNGTSQRKMGTLVKRDRKTVNKALKNAYGLTSKQRFVKVSKSLLGKFDKKIFNSFQKLNLNGYRMNHEGELFRQIANGYKLNTNELHLIWGKRKTFFDSNKMLNKSLFEESGSCTSVTKFLSLQRSARKKRKLTSQFQRAKMKKLGMKFNGKKFISLLYKPNKTKEGSTLTLYYEKLYRELKIMCRLGIPIKKFHGDYKIYSSENFASLTESNLIRLNGEINNYLNFKSNNPKAFRRSRRIQRLYFEFNHKSYFNSGGCELCA